MAKRAKPLASRKIDGQLLASVKNSANQIWLAGLGAFAKAQEEGGSFFDTLVEKARRCSSARLKRAGDNNRRREGPGDRHWGKLERVFEDRVGQALARPQRADQEGYRCVLAACQRTHRGHEEADCLSGRKTHHAAAKES